MCKLERVCQGSGRKRDDETSLVAAGKIARCQLVFPGLHNLQKSWGGPLVRSRRPRRPSSAGTALILLARSGSRGTRADQGVRPTICTAFSNVGETKWHWARVPAPQKHPAT